MTGPIISVTLEDGRTLRLNAANIVGYAAQMHANRKAVGTAIDTISGVTYTVIEHPDIVDHRIRSAS